MSPKRRARSVEADTLETLRRRGAESGVLDARLAWSELEGIRRYVADMAGRARIVPLMLPTAQASGRWSTTQPPLTNWPRHDPQECPGRDAHSEAWCPLDVRGLLLPDPGTYWVKFDWDAVEARLAATYTQDPDDLAAFQRTWCNVCLHCHDEKIRSALVGGSTGGRGVVHDSQGLTNSGLRHDRQRRSGESGRLNPFDGHGQTHGDGKAEGRIPNTGSGLPSSQTSGGAVSVPGHQTKGPSGAVSGVLGDQANIPTPQNNSTLGCSQCGCTEERLEASDIHVLTLCRMLGWDVPKLLSKALHIHPSCAPWRDRYEWGGPDDRRRHLAKTVRYALLYAEDHRGVLSAKGVEKLGYTKAQLEDFGRAYLRAKPAFVAAKSRVQAECGRTGLARSAFGRLRRLSGDASTRGKEGWSHTISATVSDMMNTVLIGIHAAVPECWLVVNRHDGAEIAFPASVPVERAHGALRGLVEREWSFWGHAFRCPATWEVVDAEGEHQRL